MYDEAKGPATSRSYTAMSVISLRTRELARARQKQLTPSNPPDKSLSSSDLVRVHDDLRGPLLEHLALVGTDALAGPRRRSLAVLLGVDRDVVVLAVEVSVDRADPVPLFLVEVEAPRLGGVLDVCQQGATAVVAVPGLDTPRS